MLTVACIPAQMVVFYPLWSIQLLTGVLCCSIWGAAFASCRFGALRDKRSDQSSKEGTPLLCFWTSFTFPFRSGSSCHHACGEGALRLGQCGEVLGEPAWAPNEEPIQVGTCFSRLHLAVYAIRLSHGSACSKVQREERFVLYSCR